MSEHTPTPWHTDDGWKDGVYDVVGAEGEPICMVAHGDVDHETRTINAAFIVKAVNSHDALVKAMETARRLIGAINDTAPPAVKESNINMAWHVLDDNLRAIASIKERA